MKLDFYKDGSSEFLNGKVIFSENTLFNVNQADLTIHKFSEQIFPAANVSCDIETYDCGPNKARILYPPYKVTTGDFKGYEEIIGIIYEEVF